MNKESEYYGGQSHPLEEHDHGTQIRFLKKGRKTGELIEGLTQKNLQGIRNVESVTDNFPASGERINMAEVQLQVDLKVAQAKIKSLEIRLKNIEKLYSAKGDKLSEKFQQLQSESTSVREESNAQKQMYLGCLQEIEQKNELTKKKLRTALREIEDLRKNNQLLITNTKSLQEEIGNLKLSLKATLKDRRRIRNILKFIGERNSGLGTQELYRKTTQRAQDILDRRSESEHIIPNRYESSQPALHSLVSKTNFSGAGDEEDEIIQELFYIF